MFLIKGGAKLVSCVTDAAMASLFLDLAKTYHGHADGMFRLFITVLFSSFAFASGFPMTNIGKKWRFGNAHVSTPSLAVAFVLMSFYIISFMSYRSAIVNAHRSASEFVTFHRPCKGLDVLKSMLGFEGSNIWSLWLPQVGFVLGSIMGVLVFIYLANSKREKSPEAV